MLVIKRSFHTNIYLRSISVACAEYEAAKYLLLDALHDIMEIEKCQDCYRHSSIKDDDHWFVKPCQPPHDLVYAKQTGYSYWPAKVIRKMDGVCDVRFFGQQHTRALIPLRNIKSLDDKLPAIKRSVKLTKALAELKQHQELLTNYVPGQRNFEIVSKPRPIIKAQRKAPQNKKKPPQRNATEKANAASTDLNKNQNEAVNGSIINLTIIDEVNSEVITSTPNLPKKIKLTETPLLDCSDNESASSTISDYLGREADDAGHAQSSSVVDKWVEVSQLVFAI